MRNLGITLLALLSIVDCTFTQSFGLNLELLQPSPNKRDNWGQLGGGSIFRSRKLSSPALRYRLQNHGIRSILCFSHCTSQEQKIAELASVQYFEQNLYIPDLQVSDLVKIVKTLKRAPKPLLIHCRAGADRTGMAVALFHYAIEKMTMDQAMAHSLKFAFGHLGRWNTPRIYEVLREYEQQFPNE